MEKEGKIEKEGAGQLNLVTDPYLEDGKISIEVEQRKDPMLKKIIKYISEQELPKTKKGQAIIRIKAPKYYVMNGILCVRHSVLEKARSLHNLMRPTHVIAVPHSMKMPLLTAYHDSMCGGGHVTYVKLYEKLLTKYYWEEIKLDSYQYVKGCEACNARKGMRRALHPALRKFPPVTEPGMNWLMDHCGPFPPSVPEGYTHILVFLDEMSRWPEAFCTYGTKAEDVARIFLEEITCRYGSGTLCLRSDNARSFKNQLMSDITRITGTTQIFGAPKKPSSQGLVEKFNATIYDCIAMYINDKHQDWSRILNFFLLSARTTFHRTTQEAPAFLFLGRDLHLPFDNAITDLPRAEYYDGEDYAIHSQLRLNAAWKIAQENMEVATEIQKRDFDQKRYCAPYSYSIGMKVWLKSYKQPPKGRTSKFFKKYFGPFRIQDITNQFNYHLALIKNPRVKLMAPYQRIKPYFEPYFPPLRRLDPDEEDSDESDVDIEEFLERKESQQVTEEEDDEEGWLQTLEDPGELLQTVQESKEDCGELNKTRLTKASKAEKTSREANKPRTRCPEGTQKNLDQPELELTKEKIGPKDPNSTQNEEKIVTKATRREEYPTFYNLRNRNTKK